MEYRYPEAGAPWIESPNVQVTNTPEGTELVAINPGDSDARLADLVLFCVFCVNRAPFKAAEATWVSWGVMVDAEVQPGGGRCHRGRLMSATSRQGLHWWTPLSCSTPSFVWRLWIWLRNRSARPRRISSKR